MPLSPMGGQRHKNTMRHRFDNCIVWSLLCCRISSGTMSIVASHESVDGIVDSAAATRTVCTATSTNVQIGTTFDVTSVTSTLILPITSPVTVATGQTESDVSQCKLTDMQSPATGPNIAPAGDGSIKLTLSYSPLTVENVSGDHLSLTHYAAASLTDKAVIGTMATDVDLPSSSVASTAEGTVIQRFVSCLRCLVFSFFTV